MAFTGKPAFDVILFDADGNPFGVQDGVGPAANMPRLLIAGIDSGGVARTVATNTTGNPVVSVPGVATDATLALRNNSFATLINAQPSSTSDEIRMDDVAGGDLYIGRNADGTATSTATWEVVRIYRTATGQTTRMRYKTGISWDNRANGANWP